MKHYVITCIIFGTHRKELSEVPLNMEHANWTSETAVLLASSPPSPLGFPPPPRDAGVAGDGAFIRTPTSPRVGVSVTFSDTVQVKGAEGNTGRTRGKTTGTQFGSGSSPREEWWERS